MTDSRPAAAGDYLRRLELLLRTADPRTRAEVLDGIAEHLDEAAAGGAVELQETIQRLGPPERTAAAVLGDAEAAASSRVGTLGIWLGASAVIATVAGSGLLAAALTITSHFDDDADWNLSPLLAFLMLTAITAIAAIGLALVWTSRWSRGRRIQLSAVLVGSLAASLVLYPIALLLPAGAGFLLAPLVLIAATLTILLVLRWSILATT